MTRALTVFKYSSAPAENQEVLTNTPLCAESGACRFVDSDRAACARPKSGWMRLVDRETPFRPSMKPTISLLLSRSLSMDSYDEMVENWNNFWYHPHDTGGGGSEILKIVSSLFALLLSGVCMPQAQVQSVTTTIETTEIRRADTDRP